jgi:hypothetical protein
MFNKWSFTGRDLLILKRWKRAVSWQESFVFTSLRVCKFNYVFDLKGITHFAENIFGPEIGTSSIDWAQQ